MQDRLSAGRSEIIILRISLFFKNLYRLFSYVAFAEHIVWVIFENNNKRSKRLFSPITLRHVNQRD